MMMVNWASPFISRVVVSVELRKGSFLAGQDYRLFSNSAIIEPTSTVPQDVVDLIQSRLDPIDEAMITLLMNYKEKYGDCHVPTGTSKFVREERRRFGVSEDLAKWAVKQRTLYRFSKDKKGKMTGPFLSKVTILESMGFLWSCREAQWQRSFNRLEEYFRKNGHMRLHRERDPQLWTWTDQQRKVYQKNKLSPEREALLRGIGFLLDPNEFQWWENYQLLIEYRDEHGDTLVPANYEKDPYFGKWVARQRRLYHINQVPEDRIHALNEAGFVWAARQDAWEKHYEELCDFYKENNHTRVPKSMGPLWNWVDRQRRRYKEVQNRRLQGGVDESDESGSPDGTLLTNTEMKQLADLGFEIEDEGEKSIQQETQARMKRLEEITFEGAPHDEKWMKNFERLCQFKEDFGHFAVPSDEPEYSDLSTWVRHQRHLFKGNRVADDRIALLNGIEFAWTAEAARWDRLYEELATFYAKNGHARIPVRNGELYRWTKQQKKALSEIENTLHERANDDKSIQRLLALHRMIF